MVARVGFSALTSATGGVLSIKDQLPRCVHQGIDARGINDVLSEGQGAAHTFYIRVLCEAMAQRKNLFEC